jgi:hypothetical protein
MRPASLASNAIPATVMMLCAACAADLNGPADPEHDDAAVAANRGGRLDGSLVPGYPDVVGEYIQIQGARTAGTPIALDTGAFLRVRSALDGERPRSADAVVIAMPGFSSVPSHWLFLAAQLVHKANQRTCGDERSEVERGGEIDRGGGGCRIEVWIIDRRGSNLEDTFGLLLAHARRDPDTAIDYYFGRSILSLDPDRPGKFPFIAPQNLPAQPDAVFRPLEQADVPFVAEWGFEAHAGDVDRMIALIQQRSGADNIFLAGHSQGGAFISSYAGRRGRDGRRGFEKLAGLIALDPAPLNGRELSPTDAALDAYFAGVEALRTGATQVFTNGTGALPNYNGPRAGALTSVAGVGLGLRSLDDESILPIRQVGALPFTPAGDAFLRKIRLTNLAGAGMGIDTDPLPGRSLQNAVITALGEGLGRLDFTPRPGTEAACDPQSPAGRCLPDASQIDPDRVYRWVDGGGQAGATEVGSARLWAASLAFSPSRTNVVPVLARFAVSGLRVVYAGDMNASTWYPSIRYDSDMAFLGTFHSVNIQQSGVSLDIDRDAIDVPVFMSRRTNAASNVLPLVTDYTEINRAGVTQTPAAAALTPIDPAVNVALYNHTDFVSADDSLAGQVTPGQPGASAVADTLIDWVLARAHGALRRALGGAGRLEDRDALLDERDVASLRRQREVGAQRHDRRADVALLRVREAEAAEAGGVGRHVAEHLAIRADRGGRVAGEQRLVAGVVGHARAADRGLVLDRIGLLVRDGSDGDGLGPLARAAIRRRGSEAMRLGRGERLVAQSRHGARCRGLRSGAVVRARRGLVVRARGGVVCRARRGVIGRARRGVVGRARRGVVGRARRGAVVRARRSVVGCARRRGRWR